MKFPMVINWNRKTFRVVVVKVYHDRSTVRYEVKGRNRTVTVESNEPLLRLRNLTKWTPDYKIISGKFNTPGFEKALIDALHFSIAAYEKKNP